MFNSRAMATSSARAICLISFMFSSSRGLQAFPTSSNIIPAADMLGKGELQLELENDGYTALLDANAEYHFLTQYGLYSLRVKTPPYPRTLWVRALSPDGERVGVRGKDGFSSVTSIDDFPEVTLSLCWNFSPWNTELDAAGDFCSRGEF
ncbi:MAG: hypothetical protein AUJ92_17160 [Armatimonadetes bacterium CG2_30_59_28]|nr:hypothetical protein [Armatimonadota bacterium]OIO91137.1 MAG: hypothetical protein AUJ92_17160 [Armatimonadetes bacterium CG2_30_59_28]PIU62128.1 MAG: hypothetical protein COS85_19375 [Armatimonadetes bacterium CG07_land_8_20_14_0_80_59_28]PIX46074.1 MAG: hypothetical protein COZ56_00385 [Armatimonadetes bacterium CG_4_8_14_3_um_filter_58_9]PIY46406.1 MAG: hypothetical protein COZ05_05835 [Armatimonadetes bacterium CG_4_10_14_3_um_filter_59_10]